MKWKILLFSLLFSLLIIPSAAVSAVYAADPIVGRLEQPVLTMNDSVVSWEAVPGAQAYYFYFTLNGSPTIVPGMDEAARTLVGNGTTSFDIKDFTNGGTSLSTLNYNYGVVVTALYGLTLEEFPSNNSVPAFLQYSIRQLAQPTVTILGRFARWNAVDNAVSYSVYATKGTGDDQITSQILTTAEPEMDIKELFNHLQDDDYEIGDAFTFHVKALHGTQYLFTASEEKTADGTVSHINIDQDTVRRRGGFEIVWNAVPGATEYSITFFGIAGNTNGITKKTADPDFDLGSILFGAGGSGFEYNKEYTVAITPLSAIGFFAEGETVTIPWSLTKNDNTWMYIVMGVGLGLAAIYGILVWYGNKKKIRTHIER